MLILATSSGITDFCTSTAELWGLLGLFITIFKIVIPVMLIVLGMFDMGKAVTSGKDDEIKKQLLTFAKRVVAAVLVFFIPTIVGLVMQAINSAASAGANAKENYCACISKVTGIGSCS